MKTTPDNLPDDISELKNLLLSEREKIAALEARNNILEELFRLAQQKRFGKSSEAHLEQGDLFNEAKEIANEVPEPEVETINYTRKKPKRQPLPKDLPREIRVHDLSDAEKSCDCCGEGLHQLGEKKSEQLEFA